MLKHMLTAKLAACAIIVAWVGGAQSQTYSPEKMSVSFPEVSQTPVRFVECKDKTCIFQSKTPLVSALFLADDVAQSIKMLSVTFHLSEAEVASSLIRDALKFAQYPKINNIDMVSLLRASTPSGRDVEIQKGLGARLVNRTDIDRHVFSFRFYPIKD